MDNLSPIDGPQDIPTRQYVDDAEAAAKTHADTQDDAHSTADRAYTDAALAALSVDDLTDVDTSTSPPLLGDALMWNGTEFVPAKMEDGGVYLPIEGGIMNGILLLKESAFPLALEAVPRKYVDAAGYDVPRWRGLLANKAQATGATEATVVGTQAVYDQNKITFSGGMFTISEGGIYMVGGRVRTSRGPAAEQRSMLTLWNGGANPYRFAFARGETFGGFGFVVGFSDGAKPEFKVYQNTGATSTFSEMYVNIAKIAQL